MRAGKRGGEVSRRERGRSLTNTGQGEKKKGKPPFPQRGRSTRPNKTYSPLPGKRGPSPRCATVVTNGGEKEPRPRVLLKPESEEEKNGISMFRKEKKALPLTRGGKGSLLNQRGGGSTAGNKKKRRKGKDGSIIFPGGDKKRGGSPFTILADYLRGKTVLRFIRSKHREREGNSGGKMVL